MKLKQQSISHIKFISNAGIRVLSSGFYTNKIHQCFCNFWLLNKQCIYMRNHVFAQINTQNKFPRNQNFINKIYESHFVCVVHQLYSGTGGSTESGALDASDHIRRGGWGPDGPNNCPHCRWPVGLGQQKGTDSAHQPIGPSAEGVKITP